MKPPAAAIAILEPLTLDDLQDLLTSMLSAAMNMEIERLDLHEFTRAKLIDMIWMLAAAGPPLRIGDGISYKRLPDHEALEKLRRLADSLVAYRALL